MGIKIKELFLLRGVSNAGKSTLAKSLGGINIEADMYFINNGEYKFDASKLKQAHNWCQSQTGAWMSTDGQQVNVDRIVVSNTFTQEWEMKPYFEMAEKYGYRVYSLIVEKRHNNFNDHNVPDEKLNEMAKRFEIKLI
jgi:predicted kinase